MMVPPFRQISEVANINYALVEYSHEQGGLGMLPSSQLRFGLYLVVTSQYSSTALYQVSYHIQ